MSRSIPALLALSTLCASACLPNKHGTTDDSSVSDDTGQNTGETVTVQDLRKGNVAQDSIVTLERVIVTSPLTADGKGFFVEAPEGGEYSGVFIYLGGDLGDTVLTVGDEINLTGTYTEYYGFSEISIGGGSDITVTGEGTITPEALGNDVSDWEPWESVLVKVSDQTMEDVSDYASYGEVAITAGCKMDNLFFDYDAAQGAHMDSVTGPVTYNFKEYKIGPRTADDIVGYGGGIPGGDSTVAEIQQGKKGGTIHLTGVVATTGTDIWNEGVWVQDAGGGEWSGIYVFLGKKNAITINIGDTLDVDGTTSEFYDVTEVTAYDQVTVTGTGGTPTVTAVSSAPSDWEPYEGVLVSLDGVSVDGTEDAYGQCPLDVGILTDDLLYAMDCVDGTSFTSVVGVVTYSFKEWKVLPRAATDIQTGKASTIVSKISEIRSHGDTSGHFEIDGVIATSAVATNGSGFFVQEEAGGPNSGMFIYLGSLVDEINVGDELTITGDLTEYYGFLELQVSSVDDIVVTDTGLTPIVTELKGTKSLLELEVYEGVLIRLPSAQPNAAPDTHGESTLAGSWNMTVDDLLYSYSVDVGSDYEITGLLNYAYDAWKLCPRSADDIVAL